MTNPHGGEWVALSVLDGRIQEGAPGPQASDVRLELRADFFNFASHASFNIPERCRGNAGFGRAHAAIGTGRQRQIGLRLKCWDLKRHKHPHPMSAASRKDKEASDRPAPDTPTTASLT